MSKTIIKNNGIDVIIMKKYSSEYIEIGKIKQYVSIFGVNHDLPLLLYIHGGPGDAALPLVYKYNYDLINKFTVVVWEQRGAGKSYYPFKTDSHVTIDMFIEDLHEVVTYLLKKFNQEKLYLLGHSWGSVLGLQYVKRYPNLLHSYFGCGQVVNMREGFKRQYDFVLNESIKNDDTLLVKKLTNVDISLTQKSWLEDLLLITKLVVKYQRSLYGKSNYNRLIKNFVFSPTYSLFDLINRERGSLQSIKFLWQELMGVDFSSELSFDIPVVFYEGRHDYHVSSELVEDYYQNIKSSKKIIWFENSSHFPQWEEPDKFNMTVTPNKN